MNPETYQKGMARMGAALSVEPTPGQMAIYWEELGDLDDVTFTAAVKGAIRNAPKMYALPTIAAILKEAAVVSAALGNGPMTALDAWASFRKKVSRINLDILGHTPEVEIKRIGLTDTDMAMARRLGGWAHLAMMPPKDLDWKAKEFTAHYGEAVERRRAEDAVIALEPARPLRTPMLAEGGER